MRRAGREVETGRERGAALGDKVFLFSCETTAAAFSLFSLFSLPINEKNT